MTSSRARSVADKAKLLLHYGSRIVAIKGYDLSTLEAKNIDTRDIYCLARGSYSFRTKGQLTLCVPRILSSTTTTFSADVDAK